MLNKHVSAGQISVHRGGTSAAPCECCSVTVLNTCQNPLTCLRFLILSLLNVDIFLFNPPCTHVTIPLWFLKSSKARDARELLFIAGLSHSSSDMEKCSILPYYLGMQRHNVEPSGLEMLGYQGFFITASHALWRILLLRMA